MSADASPDEAGGATRIVAIRHGETPWNVDGRIQGQLDIPLNDTGLWQAQRMAEALADEPFDALYSSDLARARQTAEALAARVGLPLQFDEGLRERHFGRFQGWIFPDIERDWPEAAHRWRHRDPLFEPDGGESLTTFSARCVGTVARLAAAHPGQSIAVVAHGGVMDSLYRAATHLALDSPRSWELRNASINRLLYAHGGFTLVGWDDRLHLEGNARDEASEP